jgi:adenylate cyclase
MNGPLEISTLGGLSIHCGDQPVTGFDSRKVEALLVYVACSGRPQSRDVLADLLWDDLPQPRALGNLRVVLHSLRKQLDPYVTVTRDAVALNPEAAIWLDVAEFEEKLSEGRIEEAVALYHGDFLQGFYVRGARRFEDWAIVECEQLRQLALDALGELVTRHLETGTYRDGIVHARRLVQLDPYLEDAHRQLMRLLAFGGQRGAALAQYETCRRILKEELGVEPAAETTALYEQIQAGELEIPIPYEQVVLRRPAFLDVEAERDVAPRPVFVTRERELERLHGFLDAALAGEGRVVFVTGGPGRGKTALLDEFAWRGMDEHPSLLVVRGSCNAYAGVGDPYLPFREVMGMLTGDVESRWAAGTISQDHARRLWDIVPFAVQALLAWGTSLLDTFVPAAALLSRAAVAAPADSNRLEQLRELAARAKVSADSLEQSYLFEQYTNVLHALAARHPLLLILDDLQWMDTASISLLFHLGRRLAQAGSRVLIACAYRPEEVALGRDGQRHPLEKILSEFKRLFGDVWVDLGEVDEVESRRFVDAFLDTEPNRLEAVFRGALLCHTQGHPLFTIELLRAMQDRGDLVQDEGGRWVKGATLDWETLPPRVEGVIEERVGRLGPELREILTVASVEGEDFTVQVLAQVLEISERQLLKKLSRELAKSHRLVREQEELTVDHLRLSRYRFAHALFQQYLYNGLGAGERRLIHGEIAVVLESLYHECPEKIVVELARHFVEAENWPQAFLYHHRAGEYAQVLFANENAIAHFRKALGIAEKCLPNLLTVMETAELEKALIDVYERLGDVTVLNGHYSEALAHYAKARAMVMDEAQSIVQMCHLADLCRRSAIVYERQSEYRTAFEWLEKGLDYLDLGEPPVEAARIYLLGTGICRRRGENNEAFEWCEKSLEVASRIETTESRRVLAQAYYNLGGIYTDRADWPLAEQFCRESVRVYQEIDDIFGLPLAHINLANVYFPQGNWPRATEHYLQALEITCKTGDVYHNGLITANLGGVYRDQGDLDQAESYYRQSLETWQKLGSTYVIALLHNNMGSIELRRGKPDQALALLKKSEALFREIGSKDFMAEVYRHLAEAYLGLEELGEALSYAQDALAQALEQEMRLEEGAARRVLGQVHQARRNLAQAEQELQESLDILGELDSHYEVGQTLFQLAHLYRDQEREREAEAVLSRAIEVFERLGARLDLQWALDMKKGGDVSK